MISSTVIAWLFFTLPSTRCPLKSRLPCRTKRILHRLCLDVLYEIVAQRYLRIMRQSSIARAIFLPFPSLVPIQSCHKDSWRLALQQWGGPALIAEEKAIFATDPPWEPVHQSVSNGGDVQGSGEEDGRGGWWSQKPAWPRLRAGEVGGNIGVCQRIRRDLIGEQLLVITGYFWQFDVSSRL